MSNCSSSSVLGALLAGAIGVILSTTTVASEPSVSTSRAAQDANATRAKQAATPQKSAARQPSAGKAAGRTAPAPKAATGRPSGVTKTASTAKATARPAKTAAKPRRGTPASDEPTVAQNAACYQRTAGRGRCEPQCLPYTRCRSGISSCRTGHENGPVTWFRCEQSRGNTSHEPAGGRVLVLGRNAHGMPTGHTLFVEHARPLGDGRYDLTLSHTNYDRRCNLETNMVAEYDPASQTIDVRSGKWEPWGRELKVAGFIHN